MSATTASDQGGAPGSGGLDRAVLRFAPGLIRVAVTSGWRIASWSVSTSIETTNQVLRSVAQGESPTKAIGDVVTMLRSIGRQALGIAPPQESAFPVVRDRPPGRSVEELRMLGAALLARS